MHSCVLFWTVSEFVNPRSGLPPLFWFFGFFFRFLFHLFFPCDPVDGYTRLDGIDILDESKEEIPRFAPIVLPDRIHDSFFFGLPLPTR